MQTHEFSRIQANLDRQLSGNFSTTTNQPTKNCLSARFS